METDMKFKKDIRGVTEDINLKEEKKKVLNKVKIPTFIPNTELMTTKMVAEYFEVSQEVIRDNIRRNDLAVSSVNYKTAKNLFKLNQMTRDSIRSYGVNTAGITRLFKIETVISLAFLLRKSNVAAAMRDEILNQSKLAKYYRKEIVKLDDSFIKENTVYNQLLSALDGLVTFEREVQCGDYFVDIVLCNGDKRIAVEVDEFGHKNYNHTEEKVRESFIEKQGYKLIRFNPDDETGNDILSLTNQILRYFLTKGV